MVFDRYHWVGIRNLLQIGQWGGLFFVLFIESHRQKAEQLLQWTALTPCPRKPKDTTALGCGLCNISTPAPALWHTPASCPDPDSFRGWRQVLGGGMRETGLPFKSPQCSVCWYLVKRLYFGGYKNHKLWCGYMWKGTEFCYNFVSFWKYWKTKLWHFWWQIKYPKQTG